jgi:hypothetical protein
MRRRATGRLVCSVFNEHSTVKSATVLQNNVNSSANNSATSYRACIFTNTRVRTSKSRNFHPCYQRRQQHCPQSMQQLTPLRILAQDSTQYTTKKQGLNRTGPCVTIFKLHVTRGTTPQAGRSWVRFPTVSLEFFIDIILPAALWPWGRLSLYRKWVPGIFPGR